MAEQITSSMYGGQVELMFQPGRHRYNVTIPTRGIIKQYMPSVTTIVGRLDKPALVQWAANQAGMKMVQLARGHVDDVLLSIPPDSRISPDHVQIPLRVVLGWENDVRFRFRDVKREAAEIGTLAHDYLEQHLRWAHIGGPQPQRPKAGDGSEITPEMRDMANNAIDGALQWFTLHELKLIEVESLLYSARHGYVGKQDWKMLVDGERCNGDFKSGSGIYDEVWMQLAAYKQAGHEMNPRERISASWAIHIDKNDGDFNAIRRPDHLFDVDLQGFLGLLDNWKWAQICDGKTLPPTGLDFGNGIIPKSRTNGRRKVNAAVTN